MLTLLVDPDCMHCRSISNLMTYKGIVFQTETVDGDIYDVPILKTEYNEEYVGFQECLEYIRNKF